MRRHRSRARLGVPRIPDTPAEPAGRPDEDPRLAPPIWPSTAAFFGTRLRLRFLTVLNVAVAVWYFGWLLQPGRVGSPVLYGLLLGVELFNLVQAAGFWWTVGALRSRPRPARRPGGWTDVFIPVYNEPLDVVGLTVAAAARLRGAVVYLLDDKGRPELVELAARYGVTYFRRDDHRGAKAGNLNRALARTTAPFVAVFDCDHVVDRRFLDATLPLFADPALAFVQTPQYYANSRSSPVARAAWSQQALFFGAIAQGKDAMGAMFCCGTNVVFRRQALEEVGGFPEESLTEDFELSIHLHERGWRSAYLPEVLARGLGPEDAASYVSQQLRWSRGCLSAFPTILRARLPWRLRAHYLLSASYFLTGWTFIVYMSFPVARILLRAQPLAAATASSFLVHFAPYFVLSLLTVATAGAGAYSFSAYTLAFASFWIHVLSSLRAILRRPGRFVVTAKQSGHGRQPRVVAPALVAATILTAVAGYGLIRSTDQAMLNNVAFAGLHVSVLLAGAWGALSGDRPASAASEPTAASPPGRQADEFVPVLVGRARPESTHRPVEPDRRREAGA